MPRAHLSYHVHESRRSMFGECHAHIAMDGVNYAQAMKRHENAPDEAHIRACFEAYRQQGITFVRDGGDKFGVSLAAKEIAPEYDIDYRSPIFAIHKQGNYGSIVGRAFADMNEYAVLVDEAEALGADAVIGLRYGSSQVMDTAAEVLAYGTAVKVIEK